MGIIFVFRSGTYTLRDFLNFETFRKQFSNSWQELQMEANGKAIAFS